MLVLGFHGGYTRIDEDNRARFTLHDGAAALVRDGQTLAAIEEERLTRIKHSNSFPVEAIRYCLREHDLGLQDIDLIATNAEERSFDIFAKHNFLQHPDLDSPPGGRGFIASLFKREFRLDVSDRLRFFSHHVAHAWSAFIPSGYDSALILVLDGVGDRLSGMVLKGEGTSITKIKEIALSQSLGNLYTNLIMLLGYNRFDEYKVMGLAPYGDPAVYGDLFEKFYQLLPDGDYSLADQVVMLAHLDRAGLVNAARRKGAPFTQTHKDVAAALQVMLEKIALHILSYYKEVTNLENLCLAGGVAHNCSMNGRILYSGLFENVFVQPAAHDAGTVLGAAYAALNEAGSLSVLEKASHLYFGTHIGEDASTGETLNQWRDFLSYEIVDRVAERTAQLLADGKVVGWAQGRSEFGPRALGNRSILADPRPAENKSVINQMVKKRESYRPFAPSVLEERVKDYFDVPEGMAKYPFMIFVVRVKDEAAKTLQAITHIDGTARIHSVSKDTNPLYHELISQFEKLTGVPVVLNTSFNNNVEPIVDTAEDSIVCYLTTGLDHLVVGNYLVKKKELELSDPAYGKLKISLPRSRWLVQRQIQVEPERYEVSFGLESTVNRFFAKPLIKISKEMFRILQDTDGKQPLARLLAQAGMRDEGTVRRLTRELLDLWSERAVILRPMQ